MFTPLHRRVVAVLFVAAACIAPTDILRADPSPISGPLLLPGDHPALAAAGNQNEPFVARGGEGYLAVWAEGRTNLFYPPPFGEEQGARDIYAARLDAAGVLVDSIPIVVNQVFGRQTGPQASWNGQNWLVVWETQAPTEFY